MHQIRFVIIDSNILVCLGLQHLICDLLPMAEVVICRSYEELAMQEDAKVKKEAAKAKMGR